MLRTGGWVSLSWEPVTSILCLKDAQNEALISKHILHQAVKQVLKCVYIYIYTSIYMFQLLVSWWFDLSIYPKCDYPGIQSGRFSRGYLSTTQVLRFPRFLFCCWWERLRVVSNNRCFFLIPLNPHLLLINHAESSISGVFWGLSLLMNIFCQKKDIHIAQIIWFILGLWYNDITTELL